MTVPARVNIITLGVKDLEASAAFYQRLGWRFSEGASQDEIRFFALDNIVLALFGREALVADQGGTGTPGAPRGFTLAINVASPQDVDATVEAALAAGGILVKQPEKVFWGGYSGYFADPDGTAWEVAHNPFIALNEAGALALPD